jgi:hypothetical protein
MTDPNIKIFQELVDEYRYDFHKLVYVLWPFGEEGSELENEAPYDWQIEEWVKLSKHLKNPLTRTDTYRLIISSGNGAAKTAFGAMTTMMLMYTQMLRGRITTNTEPQMRSIIWPEYDKWVKSARFVNQLFDKQGTTIKARNKLHESRWRIDTVTWTEQNPTAISGLHNKGGAILYVFEEAAGIPANIWDYASGAFTDRDTIKVWLAFANSDDPDSKFEQNMKSPSWHSRRIDTRSLTHIDPKQVETWLMECGGNEDHDDFRVRVRGLPRKSAKDSIIGVENIEAALARRKDFDVTSVHDLPCVLSCDPAWKGGDFTTIWMRQGHYACMLEKYVLEGEMNHMYTYQRLCWWERELKADAVFIDQGEGTAIYTLAHNAGKYWELVSFGSAANDAPDFQSSQYGNIRAQMYHESNQWLLKGGVLDAKNEEWIDEIRKQLAWTKGSRHRVHGKKMAEPKVDIKKRIGMSPDVADGFVLGGARPVTEKAVNYFTGETIGEGALKMPDHSVDYDIVDAEFKALYD